MKHRFILILAVCIVVAAGCRREGDKIDGGAAGTDTNTDTSVPSATTTGVSGGTVSAMSNEDKEFVMKAAQVSLAEVAMGQTAVQKANSPDVKAFANRMVTDHSKANDELRELANIKGLALPSEPDQAHKDAAQHVSSLDGTAFDNAYMTHMVEDHDRAVADFQNASQNAQDADLKAWAARTLSTLQDHQRLAKETQGKVK